MSDAKIIDGKAFAAGLREQVAAEVARLSKDHGIKPCLTVILVGEVGGVVFAFGDQPGDNFQVHSLCTLRNDFIRLLADRGTPLDAPVASTSAAAE